MLEPDFFAQKTPQVARELLGKKLVCISQGQRLSARIVETEAYGGMEDSACHGARGKTSRNQAMFGPPGIAYVYLVYGMHHLLNLVTEPVERPCAVLIRGAEPLEGETIMAARRGKPGPLLTNGPAKLCQALGIDKRFNGLALGEESGLWVENHSHLPEEAVRRGPRIGIHSAEPADIARPWRFWVRDNRYVSKVS